MDSVPIRSSAGSGWSVSATAHIRSTGSSANLPDVYAIGDCATVYDNSTGDVNYIALASNAVRSGIVAAVNACGGQIETEGVQGSNGISIWGFNMVSTGLSLEKARRYGLDVCAADFEDYQKPRFMNHNEKVKIRIVYRRDNRVIVGAQMASRYDISMGIHLFSWPFRRRSPSTA